MRTLQQRVDDEKPTMRVAIIRRITMYVPMVRLAFRRKFRTRTPDSSALRVN